MRCLSVFILACSLLQQAHAQCKKDACYNAVAIQSNKNPSLAVRREDCQALLRLGIDDDHTTTVTTTFIVETVSEEYSEISTVTTVTTEYYIVTSITAPRRQDTHVTTVPGDGVLLEERDTYVIKGKKPLYARACASREHHARACLCFGIKPATLNTQRKIVSVTALETVTVQETETLTATVTLTTHIELGRR